MNFYLYSYVTFEDETAPKDQAHLVWSIKQYDILSRSGASYRLMTGDLEHYSDQNYPFLTKKGLVTYKKFLAKLPYQITQQCNATMTLLQPFEFEQVSFLGKSKEFNSTTYLGLLLAPPGIERDLSLENCMGDQLDAYLTGKRFYYLAAMAWRGVVIMVSAFLVALLAVMERMNAQTNHHINETIAQPFANVNERRMKKAKIPEDTVPNEFICPITFNVMDEPATTNDAEITVENASYSHFPRYEKTALSRWFLNHNFAPHAPYKRLTDLTLKTDLVLKERIEDFLKKGESLFAHKKQRALLQEKVSQRKMRARSK